MAESLKHLFTATQDSLRRQPAQAFTTFTAEAKSAAGLSSQAAARQFSVPADLPPSLGGADRGPAPVELVLAALGACQEATYRLYADALGIPLNSVSVKLEGRVDLRGLFAVHQGVRPGFRDIRGTVTIDSPASSDDIDRLRAMVDRHCPVLDVLRNVTPVGLKIRLADDPQAAAA